MGARLEDMLTAIDPTTVRLGLVYADDAPMQVHTTLASVRSALGAVAADEGGMLALTTGPDEARLLACALAARRTDAIERLQLCPIGPPPAARTLMLADPDPAGQAADLAWALTFTGVADPRSSVLALADALEPWVRLACDCEGLIDLDLGDLLGDALSGARATTTMHRRLADDPERLASACALVAPDGVCPEAVTVVRAQLQGHQGGHGGACPVEGALAGRIAIAWPKDGCGYAPWVYRHLLARAARLAPEVPLTCLVPSVSWCPPTLLAACRKGGHRRVIAGVYSGAPAADIQRVYDADVAIALRTGSPLPRAWSRSIGGRRYRALEHAAGDLTRDEAYVRVPDPGPTLKATGCLHVLDYGLARVGLDAAWEPAHIRAHHAYCSSPSADVTQRRALLTEALLLLGEVRPPRRHRSVEAALAGRRTTRDRV